MLLATDSGGLLSSADLPRGHRRAEVEEPWMVSERSGSDRFVIARRSMYSDALPRVFSRG